MNIVFFDGHCSLCNGTVDWLMSIDKNKRLKFASLQGETYRSMFHSNLDEANIDTIIYLSDSKKYERSSAILMIFSDIGGIWSLLKVFLFLPLPIRDNFYKFIAKNRYKFFGKRDTCRLPTQEERNQLLP